jgi:hypothetical protein
MVGTRRYLQGYPRNETPVGLLMVRCRPGRRRAPVRHRRLIDQKRSHEQEYHPAAWSVKLFAPKVGPKLIK